MLRSPGLRNFKSPVLLNINSDMLHLASESVFLSKGERFRQYANYV